MTFPDAARLALVRDQLWTRPNRGACVLVGSGFSKNHRASPTSTRPALSWFELAKLLHKKLYPDAGPNDPPPPASSESCPALAQEYQSTLDRPALLQLLREHIPDDHKPHRLHMQLLGLPWADVFTTNWDTLLERASHEIPARPYSPVYKGADLSHAARPRIVKLHGSLSGHGRIIITQDDYRTYDQHAAPLSNTVRQALMEGTVLLLGFSGNDANFLEWHGWVRDRLGEDTPRPFLAGYLRLPPPRRHLLEASGIVPIDLANHPEAEAWGTNAHGDALQWILDFLEQTNVAITHWPEPREPNPSRAAPLLDVGPVPTFPTVHTEPQAPPQNVSPEDEDKAVRDLIRAWREYRRSYPGWVVLPFSKVADLSARTDLWEELILRRTKGWTPSERLNALRELLWRHEVLMNPHKPDLTDAVNEAVRSLDETPASDGSPPSDSGSLLECSTAVLLPLLTEARYRLDHCEFWRVAESIRTRVAPDSNTWHQLHHEECLWALTVQDYSTLEEKLNRWIVSDCDAMWALRKSALFADMGAYDTAVELAEVTLVGLEQQFSRNSSRAQVNSRLAWALQWRMGVETQKRWSTTAVDSPDVQPILDRWSQLARYECDTRSEWRQFGQEVRDVRSPQPRGSLMPRPHRRHILRMDEYGRYRHARRSVRMIELAGIPSRITGVTMAGESLRKVAEAMGGLGAEYTLPIALRATADSSSKFLERVLSPGNVAVLDQNDADRIIEITQRGRDFRLASAQGSGPETMAMCHQAATNIEALARCISRACADKAISVFRWAVQYGSSVHFRANYSLWRSVETLWRRAWQAIPPRDRHGLLMELLSSSTLDGLSVSEYGDPSEVVTLHDATLSQEERHDARWSDCVQSLIEALRSGGNAREKAANRMRWMLDANLLKASEQSAMAIALWDTRFRDENGLPGQTKLFDFVHLSMPEPVDGIAETTFRDKWIGQDIGSGDHSAVESTLAEVVAAWRTDVLWHRPIELTRGERKWFWDLVQVWLDAGTPRSVYTWGRDDEHESRVIEGLAATMARRSVPTRIRQKLDGTLEVLSQPRQSVMMPVFHGNEYRLIAAAAGLQSGRVSRAEGLLRMGLLADDEQVQNAAFRGLCWWIAEASKQDTRLRRPRRECFQDVGMLLASGREKGVEGAMAAAVEILKTGSDRAAAVVAPLAVEGLEKWWPVLKYERSDVGGTEWDQTVVGRRIWCVRLAWTMQSCELTDHAIVGRWIEAGKKDRMAEVRYAAEGFKDGGLG